MGTEHFDVVIVGAGISGIGAGYHLQANCPDRSYVILEGRESMGGTWDLFRYPGIRSDSDMYTLGYSFRPWKEAKAIADGPNILKYLKETAADYGIDKHIRYSHKVTGASWSSEHAMWTVSVARGDTGETAAFTCNFFFVCSGYYDYDEGYTPDFQGAEDFRGRIVHPQKWTEDIDFKGKKVVVIGSGATAATLGPAIAEDVEHVTMLQRSPTYVVARPAEDKIANWLRRNLPIKLAYGMTRWKNVLMGMYFFNMCRKAPEKVKSLLLKGVRAELGPDYDVKTHFTPSYNPWDQRLCLVPNGDLFASIRDGKASVETDHIERFTEKGILLNIRFGLDQYINLTATGLKLKMLGGVDLSVDGTSVHPSETMSYKGMMYSDVPNLASCFGYTNASWTLKCDLTCEYVCRLLNEMKRTGNRQCTPRINDPELGEEPWLDLSSGYIQRAQHLFPRQGDRKPWKLYQNYAKDMMMLRFGKLDDGAMEMSNPAPSNARPQVEEPERLAS